MRLSHKCRRLADEIEGIFAVGIPIGPGVLRFITAIGQEPSPAFFARVFSDEADCEIESLIELIFSPDEAMQMHLEVLLEEGCFDAADETAIIKTLTGRRPRALLLLFSEAAPIGVPVPSGAIHSFVSRFHIGKKLDPRLIAAVDFLSAPQTKTLLKVRLRNRALVQTDSEIDFLCLFLERMPESSPDFYSSFDFLLSVIGECRNETDYRSALLRMRQKYERQKDRAEQFEHRLARSNMETIMLQGDRPPVLSAAEAKEKINRIDMLLLSLYGFKENPDL